MCAVRPGLPSPFDEAIMTRRIPVVLSVLAVLTLGAAQLRAQPTQGGPLPQPLPLFPASNWWNLDISAAPVDPNSTAFINFIGATKGLHPDFGGVGEAPGEIYGFPYIIVSGSQTKKTVLFGEEAV